MYKVNNYTIIKYLNQTQYFLIK